MISDSNVLVFILSSSILLLTPGPTNTLLAVAGVGRGSRAALPLVAVALAGYLIAISGWGIFLRSMEPNYPWVSVAVRVACGCYLLYVAIKIWVSTGTCPISESKPIGPVIVFVTTMLNPKGLLFASAIFPREAFDNMQAYLVATALFAAMVVPIGIAWLAFGAIVGSKRVSFMDSVKLQRGLALAIGVFSAMIMWTAIH
jgi:threonine/homoserine/homoserine lactone efflux protein